MKLWLNWQKAWSALARRERVLASLALAVVVTGLLWRLALAPALHTVQTAPQRGDELAQQLQSMQAMAVAAREWQGRPKVNREDAMRVLATSLQQRLAGRAQLTPAGERANVTLSGVAPELLAPWLAQARNAARVVVLQARLTRGANGWDGSIVLQLPPP